MKIEILSGNGGFILIPINKLYRLLPYEYRYWGISLEEKTYIRSVQKTGKATFIVSLPKEWILNHGLNKGSKVIIEVLDDGSLKVMPFTPARKIFERGAEAVLEMTSGDVTSIERLLIAYYEAGYDVILVKQEPYLSEELRSGIRKVLLRLSGLEIVEESSDAFILQSIIDAAQIPLSRTLERMENIVRSMLSDIEKGLEENDAKILESVVERDNELDKFYFFLGRQVALAIRGRKFATSMGLEDSVLALPYKTYGKCLEEMGDTLVSMSRYLLSGGASLQEEYKRALEILGFLERSFEWAVKAFRENDEGASKAVSNLYTSFFLSFGQDLYKPDVIALSASRFLSLCIDVVEAHVEKRALLSS
ncbi:MAG: hypothetical protein DRJ51_05405 [Thermoprotei archaeon]|nr:MAG: hypothetical protein DRJ51_05405 [Thermoprotei archaeon]